MEDDPIKCLRTGGVAVMIAMAIMDVAYATPPNEGYPVREALPPLEQVEAESTEFERYLILAEAGRLKLLAGRVEDSLIDFQRLVAHLIEYEEGPIIRLRGVHDALVAGVLIDDRGRTYQLPGYEAVLAFQHQALNHLFSGDPSSAWVELRRAFYAQYFLAQDYREKLAAVMDEVDEEAYEKSRERFRVSMSPMDQVLEQSESSFSNPYVWFMCGVMFEAQGDLNSAFQAYREALDVRPDNPYLQQDVRRLARRLGHPLPESLAGTDAESEAPRGDAEIIVLLEEGVISARRSAKTFVFVGSFQPLVIPVYDDPPYRAVPWDIAVNGDPAGSLAPLSSIQALAYHDLSEKMPGIIARNATRTTSRGITQTALRLADPVGLRAAGAVYHAATAIGDQADTRAWRTLPMMVQVARLPVAAGQQTIRVTNRLNGKDMLVDLGVRAGERKLLWIAATPSSTTAHAASLSRRGDTEGYGAMASMLGAPRFEAPVTVDAEKKKEAAQELKVKRVDQFMQGRPAE